MTRAMPTIFPSALDAVLEPIERAAWLDALADRISAVLTKALPNGPIKDAASGTPLGHPAHPVLVTVPIGSWLAATYLDLFGGRQSRPAARKLIAFGAAAALPTAFTGASDWMDTSGAERRVGLVHAATNYTALGLYASSWVARRRGSHARGVTLALVASSVLGVGGWLGGHLAYALGVGVDTTVFQHLPQDWADVAADADVTDQPSLVQVNGVPLLLVRADGAIRALADRCTHRGAPLHEGEIADGCVICPWHGSTFRLRDGSVQRGPATRPQPTLEVRTLDGRVSVRQADQQRSLRSNPVGQ
jgi:nitrite reductase/ring-hydroxylating ferredoxin subunit/uncharacterized membrane protein